VPRNVSSETSNSDALYSANQNFRHSQRNTDASLISNGGFKQIRDTSPFGKADGLPAFRWG
jgi:hypothetical protein